MSCDQLLVAKSSLKASSTIFCDILSSKHTYNSLPLSGNARLGWGGENEVIIIRHVSSELETMDIYCKEVTLYWEIFEFHKNREFPSLVKINSRQTYKQCACMLCMQILQNLYIIILYPIYRTIREIFTLRKFPIILCDYSGTGAMYRGTMWRFAGKKSIWHDKISQKERY